MRRIFPGTDLIPGFIDCSRRNCYLVKVQSN
jgi:hypothetical protein